MILWKGQRRPPVWLDPDVPLNVDVNAPDKRLSLVFELWVLWRWERRVLCCTHVVRSLWSIVQNTTPLECNFLFLLGSMFIFVPMWGLPTFGSDVSLWEIFLFTMPSPCFVSNIVKRIWIKILSSTNTGPRCQTSCFAPPSPDYKREEKQQATFHLCLEKEAEKLWFFCRQD